MHRDLTTRAWLRGGIVIAALAGLFFAIVNRASAEGAAPVATPAATAAEGTPPAGGGNAAEPPRFPEWDKVTKDAKRIEGLFPLYYNEKEQNLFVEIGPGQIDKDLICPISISRGAGRMLLGGDTLNFGDQWVLNLRRAGDRILVIRRNVYFKAREGTPQADAVKTSYTDSVILALPIRSEQGGRVLVDGADLFMTDLANLGMRPDQGRSTWGKIKGFEGNVAVEVNAVFPMSGGFFFMFGGEPDVPDMRGMQATVRYELSMLPQGSYSPRAADDRVGHFLSVMKDYSSDNDKTPKVRYVNRWKLEKADSSAEKSPPREPIIFWIEKSVPREYRMFVKDGILEWNKAFEKIGFIEAIQVRDQQQADDFDPEDIRYNAFRWITTSTPFAMGPSRANPLTGQILDADILFDESFVRYLRQDFVLSTGLPQTVDLLRSGHRQAWFKLYSSALPVLVEAEPVLMRLLRDAQEQPLAQTLDNATSLSAGRRPTPSLVRPFPVRHCCEHGFGTAKQLGLLAAVLSAQGKVAPGGKVPEEFIGQAIKEVTMHEVGHTLGLRHNFKASTMLSLADVHNTEITGKKSLAGSVMDYLPANIARKGQKQGDYFSRTIGPYDYWAIEYAYKPISGNEEEELAKIASRVAEPELTYGTDEDMYSNPDPRINTYDLGDPLEYAKERVALVEEQFDGLADRMVADGEGWQRSRDAFMNLLGELSQSTYLAAQYIGAEYSYRDHKGDPNGRTPFDPIPGAKQRDAMTFLAEHVLSEKAFHFSPELLRRLAPEFYSDWSFPNIRPVGIYSRVLSVQQIVLSHFLDSDVLKQVQEIELHATPEQDVLKMPEIFDSLATAIWSELPSGDPANAPSAGKLAISNIRRNLQRDHAKRLCNMLLGSSEPIFFIDWMGDFGMSQPPADAKALTRMHLTKLLARIKQALEAPTLERDAYSQAHLEDLKQQIEKTLAASLLMSN